MRVFVIGKQSRIATHSEYNKSLLSEIGVIWYWVKNLLFIIEFAAKCFCNTMILWIGRVETILIKCLKAHLYIFFLTLKSKSKNTGGAENA